MVRAAAVALATVPFVAEAALRAASDGNATPRWIFLVAACAALVGSLSVNALTNSVVGWRETRGVVPERSGTARSGVHNHTPTL
jgi:hypothetical protein